MDNNKQTAQYKATEYIYELGNASVENGFKADEHWEVKMVTANEKKTLEKQYYPIIVSVMEADLLAATFQLVKTRLKQKIEEIPVPTDRFAPKPEYRYMIAFNQNRQRR
ncbi:hypothetical protein GCM10023149_24180 [Mucilaginibacter gynuensis]|uniref:Uncharacterized protein n=1 Tax=Mucilaginibacter gynuensis TaxID=1302236 RepID=A0ABP8GFA4_9SPHI